MVQPKILYTSFDQVPAPKGASTHIMAFVESLGREFADENSLTPTETVDNPNQLPIAEPQGNVVLVTPSQHDRPISQLCAGVRQLQLGCAEDNPLGRARIFRAKLKKVLEEQPFTVIHFRSIFEGAVATDPELNRKAKLIYEANGFPSIEMKYHYPQLLSEPNLIAKFERQEIRCLNAADHIVTVSETTKRWIQSRLSEPKPITVIPNGYDPETFRGRAAQLTDKGPIRLAYFGTLTHWQGVETLLESVEWVNKERNCILTIVGPASRRHSLQIQKSIQRLGLRETVSVQVAYSKLQINNLLHQSHMTVVPLMPVDRNTQQGCCPIKMIEAMASGCPVIASNLPVVQELATPDVHYAPFKPGDARNLKNVILELANDSDRALSISKSAREHCQSKLTWKHATDRLIKVYQSILRG